MMNELQLLGTSNTNYPTQAWGMVVNQTTFTTGVLVLSGTAAPWVMDAAKKLEALGSLRAGWDSYGGLQLDHSAKKLTVSTLGWLEDKELPVPAVVLGSGGTVQLEWRVKGRELEIEIGKDETVEFLKVEPGGNTQEGQAKTNLPQQLHTLTWWLLNG